MGTGDLIIDLNTVFLLDFRFPFTFLILFRLDYDNKARSTSSPLFDCCHFFVCSCR